MNGKKSLVNALRQVLRDPLRVSFDLFKIMVPVIIVVKILQEFDLIRYLAIPLGPVMKFVGLPAEMGFVWATAMVNNIYGSIIVLLSLVKDTPITTAQATVLCTMILVAHTLPIELKIAQKSGPHMMFQAISRLGSALFLGWLLYIIYSHFGLLQEPAKIILTPDTKGPIQNDSLLSWVTGEAQKLFFIFLIILGLFLLMRVLEKLKIVDVMNRVLRPVLKVMGIGPKASTITIIGNTLGISYGGGLIIHEARSGHIDKKDVFYSLTLMGLSHSLFEDTLLMVMIGGHLSGVLWARVAFSFFAVTLLVKVSSRLPQAMCDRFLWGDPK
ncbi:MAG TPA: hypothetical protein DDW42_00335 [Desulfobacteraceae bacterium]|nr:hypothetical protein [Desulfobacteraceae bacterium]